MKILFDHQTFIYQRVGGVSRYFAELISCCNKTNGNTATVSVLLSENEFLKSHHIKNALSIRNGKFPGRMTFYNFINRLLTKLQLIKGRYDVFHPTYYDTYFLKALGKRPFVLTVYDMIHEIFPDKWPNQKEIADNKAVLIRKSTHIIAISEHTKQDLLRLFPDVPAEKVSVIWLGNSPSPNLKNPNDKLHEGIYILFVGNRGEYKNFDLFVRSIAGYLKANPQVYLIAAGGGKATEEEIRNMKELEIESAVKILPFVKDEELAALYRHALVFIFPSTYEGFGLPILEAFEAECPVILSNTSCFPEIGGDAALYYDSQKPETLISAIASIKNDSLTRSELIKKGKERLTLFSWEKTALKTLDIYRAITKKHGR